MSVCSCSFNQNYSVFLFFFARNYSVFLWSLVYIATEKKMERHIHSLQNTKEQIHDTQNMLRRKFKLDVGYLRETNTWTLYFWYTPPRSIRFSNILWNKDMEKPHGLCLKNTLTTDTPFTEFKLIPTRYNRNKSSHSIKEKHSMVDLICLFTK